MIHGFGKYLVIFVSNDGTQKLHIDLQCTFPISSHYTHPYPRNLRILVENGYV